MPKMVKVYHASPCANIQIFRGRYSPKMRDHGIFVSSSWKSMLKDWLGTILHKRFGGRKKSTLEKRRRKLFDSNIQDREYFKLAMRYANQDVGVYSGLTIYHLLIPQEVFNICNQWGDELAEEAFGKNGAGAIGAWGWGVETFIFNEFIDQIKIVSRKTYTKWQLIHLMDQYNNFQHMSDNNVGFKMKEYQREIDELISIHGAAPLLVRAKKYAVPDWTRSDNATRHYRVIEDLIRPYKQQLES